MSVERDDTNARFGSAREAVDHYNVKLIAHGRLDVKEVLDADHIRILQDIYDRSGVLGCNVIDAIFCGYLAKLPVEWKANLKNPKAWLNTQLKHFARKDRWYVFMMQMGRLEYTRPDIASNTNSDTFNLLLEWDVTRLDAFYNEWLHTNFPASMRTGSFFDNRASDINRRLSEFYRSSRGGPSVPWTCNRAAAPQASTRVASQSRSHSQRSSDGREECARRYRSRSPVSRRSPRHRSASPEVSGLYKEYEEC